jgi:hypothetical protein
LGLPRAPRRIIPLLLCGVLFSAGRLAAQDADVSAKTLPGFLEIGPRIVRVNGEALPLFSAAFVLGLPRGWGVAASTSFLMRSSDVAEALPLPASSLDLSYWGVRVERYWRLGDSDRSPQFGTSLTTGAASAQLRDQATKARLRADNSFLLEPMLGARVRAGAGIIVGGSAGYRIVIGVNDLGGLSSQDLRGWTVGAFLRLGPI